MTGVITLTQGCQSTISTWNYIRNLSLTGFKITPPVFEWYINGTAIIYSKVYFACIVYINICKRLHKLEGFIKTIRLDNKIDVVLGKIGYQKVEGETEKILRLLKENHNYLPFSDKSNPDDIYNFFGMSKKTFKMTIGALYKQRKIDVGKEGILLIED